MGGRRLACGLRASGFDHYYRLGQGGLAGRREERAGVTDGLHVDDDALRVRVVAEVVDQISPAHVHHRAHADERREPDVLHKALVQDGREQSPALTQKSHVARAGDGAGESGVEARGWFHYAEAVGTDDPHPAPPGLLEDLALELCPLGPSLPETGRDNYGPLDTSLHTLADNLWHRRRRSDDERKVHPGRHFGDGRVGLYAEYARPVRVHGEDRPAERAAHEVPHDRAPHAPGPLARPDHSHRLGTEDGVQLLPFVTQNVVGRVRALRPLQSRSFIAPGCQLLHEVRCVERRTLTSFREVGSTMSFLHLYL